MERPTSAQRVPPYVPYRTFRTYIDSLSQIMPTRIDRSVLLEMSGSIQQQVLGCLRYLGLIDDVGTPREALQELTQTKGREQQSVLGRVVLASYAPIIEGLDLRTASPSQIDERLSMAGARGDTLRKSRTFFLSACEDAGIAVAFAARSTRRRGRSSSSSRSLNRQSSASSDVDWTDRVLAKFPTLDPSWSDEVKSKWFSDFRTLLNIKAEIIDESSMEEPEDY